MSCAESICTGCIDIEEHAADSILREWIVNSVLVECFIAISSRTRIRMPNNRISQVVTRIINPSIIRSYVLTVVATRVKLVAHALMGYIPGEQSSRLTSLCCYACSHTCRIRQVAHLCTNVVLDPQALAVRSRRFSIMEDVVPSMSQVREGEWNGGLG